MQAHAWLCREGPKRHLDASSVLIDYDETNSFFGRLEKSYRTQQELANATAREKTQHALQSLLDSSMTTLTRTAQRVENVAADLETSGGRQKYRKSVSNIVPTQEVEEEESFVGSPVGDSAEEGEKVKTEEESEGSFVSLFTGKRNKKSEGEVAEFNENVEAGASEKEQPSDGMEPKFKNPFAGFRKSETTPGVDHDEAAEAETGATPVFRNPFAARRSVVPEKGGADDKAEETEGPKEEHVEDPELVDVTIAPTETTKPGTFSFLARAASSGIQKVSEQQATQNVSKRNPFARFGNKPAEKPAATEGLKLSNRFGGINMNQLRMSTLSNLRGKAVGEGDKPTSEVDLVEESISFDHDHAVKTTASTDDGTKAGAEAVVEAV